MLGLPVSTVSGTQFSCSTTVRSVSPVVSPVPLSGPDSRIRSTVWLPFAACDGRTSDGSCPPHEAAGGWQADTVWRRRPGQPLRRLADDAVGGDAVGGDGGGRHGRVWAPPGL